MAREYGGGKNPVDFWEESRRRARRPPHRRKGRGEFDASRPSVEAAKPG
jgi:hypothetical protein